MKLKQYLYSQFAVTFFPIFFGLFFMLSIVSLVQIASLTSVVTLDFFELMKLYMFTIPNLVFYTLPISFLISLIITLAKLSSEYELIVITSFGLNPLRILKMFFPLTLLLTITLLIISVGLVPKAKYLSNLMMFEKQKEANFNIKASEFGQKFGDWLIYINEKNDNVYSEVKLYKEDKKSEQFILANNAVLTNDKGNLSFILHNGKSFNIEKERIHQIDFKQMDINDSVSRNNLPDFTNPYDYWKTYLAQGLFVEKFIFYILVSVFPLLSMFLVITYGYFNPRYEKNHAVSYTMLFTVIYYVSVDFLAKNIFYNTLYIIPIVWLALTYYFYSKRVKKVY